jgi:hypothetical protein
VARALSIEQKSFQDGIERVTPYVLEHITRALADAGGDQEAATRLVRRWAKKDDRLWRELREPYEGRTFDPLGLRYGLLRASGKTTVTKLGEDPRSPSAPKRSQR